MRVLFVTYSERTHFLAMVPLAWALRTAGHEVRVATQPALVDTVVRAGLTAVAVGSDHAMDGVTRRFLAPGFARRHPDLYAKVRWGRLPPFDLPDDPAARTGPLLAAAQDEVVPGYRMANEPMLADTVTLARSWRPDLVLWEPATYAGAIAAEACGADHGRVLWCLDFFGRMRRDFRDRATGLPDALGSWVANAAERHGVAWSEELVTGRFTVEQFPASLRMDAGLTSVPMRYVPYPGPAAVPDWLWSTTTDRPRIALTLGLSATDRFGGYSIDVTATLAALAGVDVEVVATVADSQRHLLGAVPANARVVPFVPLPALVPTCSVVVHHAGFGTLCTTMAAGVAQLALPEQEDALVSARRVADRGAAVVHHVTETSPEVIREEVVRVLGEPSFGWAAGALREEMAEMPSPASVAELLAA